MNVLLKVLGSPAALLDYKQVSSIEDKMLSEYRVAHVVVELYFDSYTGAGYSGTKGSL